MTMQTSKPARLKVILGDNNIEKLTLQNGIPKSVEKLMDVVQKTFGLTDIHLQYIDKDFGNDFFNLSSTDDLTDMGTIKVVKLEIISLVITVADEATPGTSRESDEGSSVTSNDTILLSSPESNTTRKEQWPKKFLIRQFSYDTELQLARGNLAYNAYNKALTLNTKPKSDILNVLTEDIYKYTPYPTDAHFSGVAKALIEKHPCLKKTGLFNDAYGWKQRLKYKMGNYRTQLKVLGCPELSINAKFKDNKSAARKMKRARRAEANVYPTLLLGETSDTLERERLDILMEMQKQNNDQVVRDKMARTFAYRGQEVVDQQPRTEDFKTRWPALFSEREVNEEFHRLVAIPLESQFFEQLDHYSSRLLALARSKTGTAGDKISPILHTFDQAEDINVKRECLLKALSILLGEDTRDLVKEFVDSQQDGIQADLEQVTMAVFSIRPEGCAELPLEDIGIVIEGITVLHGLSSVSSACALLFGLICILNLAYPKSLRYTFEVFQKVFMELDSQKMSPKVHALLGKL